jgi:hypothetical protein
LSTKRGEFSTANTCSSSSSVSLLIGAAAAVMVRVTTGTTRASPVLGGPGQPGQGGREPGRHTDADKLVVAGDQRFAGLLGVSALSEISFKSV